MKPIFKSLSLNLVNTIQALLPFMYEDPSIHNSNGFNLKLYSIVICYTNVDDSINKHFFIKIYHGLSFYDWSKLVLNSPNSIAYLIRCPKKLGL